MDAFAELRIVDFGDAPVLPADAERTHAAIEALVGEVVDAGVIPIVLGGDHSVSEPNVRAVATRARPGRPRPLRHAHGHRPRGLLGRALARDADVPARRAGTRRSGALRPDRPARLLAGAGGVRLAGGARDHVGASCTTCASSGSTRVVEQALEVVGAGPTFLTVDVDVLDPAFAPGTGTPEPGGMSSGDLLRAVPGRRCAARGSSAPMSSRCSRLRSAPPTSTALVAERVVREILTGIALSRRG